MILCHGQKIEQLHGHLRGTLGQIHCPILRFSSEALGCDGSRIHFSRGGHGQQKLVNI